MISLRIACLLIGTALGGASGGSLVQDAPAKAASKQNPFEGSETAKRAGAKLYARQCASCHGQNREGRNHTPPLAQSEIYQAKAGTLFWVLTNGELRKGMPSFAHLPGEQRWQIVAFLQDAAKK
jgi:mono/diheme cytochrome c family protein